MRLLQGLRIPKGVYDVPRDEAQRRFPKGLRFALRPGARLFSSTNPVLCQNSALLNRGFSLPWAN